MAPAFGLEVSRNARDGSVCRVASSTNQWDLAGVSRWTATATSTAVGVDRTCLTEPRSLLPPDLASAAAAQEPSGTSSPASMRLRYLAQRLWWSGSASPDDADGYDRLQVWKDGWVGSPCQSVQYRPSVQGGPRNVDKLDCARVSPMPYHTFASPRRRHDLRRNRAGREKTRQTAIKRVH